MKFIHDDKNFTLYLSGRLDTKNASEVEKEINEILAKYPGEVPVFDAEELEYISSTGLRILLNLRKKFGQSLNIINVSSNIYDTFEVTGFTELLNVKKRMRQISIKGCPVIGGGHFSTVYRLDGDTIIKVFNRSPITLEKIESDQRTAREVFIRDIPTAISYDVVKVGENYGIIYEMIDAEALSHVAMNNHAKIPELGRKAGALLKKLHTTEFKTGSLPDALEKWRNSVKIIHEHKLITDNEHDMLNKILDQIPYRNTPIHCDFHPNNILVQGDELILIDVGDASLGNPIIDFACLYFLCFLTFSFLDTPADVMQSIIGVNYPVMSELWYDMLREYFGTSDDKKLAEYEEMIRSYAMIRMVHVVADTVANTIENEATKEFRIKSMRKCIDYLKANGVKPIEGV